MKERRLLELACEAPRRGDSDSSKGGLARFACRWLVAIALASSAFMVPAEGAKTSGATSAADLAAIDRTITGVYKVISGPAGQKRDFDRMRSLFAAGATMKAIGPKGLRGGTLEDYINRNREALERDGFTEQELGRRVELWGGLAIAWSAYDGRTANGSFHERGINSFQLVKVDGKWLVASILWQGETREHPLPADLVMGKARQRNRS
jgi:hypothetical protein